MGGGSGVANDVGVGCGVLSGKLRLRGHRAVGFSASIGQLLTLIIEISRRETACGNHVIAKVLVSTAERTGRGIALENLTHIRSRVSARRGQRARLHNWSFGQLRAFVAYKAAMRGVPVLAVDPRYTSIGCLCCGVIDKKN
jgi:IS605 OrfB family transposase